MGEVAAVWVPSHAVQTNTVNAYVTRAVGAVDGRCLHQSVRSTGIWVCVLDAGHNGPHG